MYYEGVENNHVTIAGIVVGEVKYSHSIMGEAFYLFYLDVPRYSGDCDTVPCLISERALNIEELVGSCLQVKGQYRSHNKYDEVMKKSRLLLTVFVQQVDFLEGLNENFDNNRISLVGHICKAPIYRMTPKGKEICDGFIAINRPYKKSDYIPLIAWGRNANYLRTLDLGDKVSIRGRIQSRTYQKKDHEGNMTTQLAYEVSVSSILLEAEEE